MMHLDDTKRLFLDMQEHPENYADGQLEAMMADLDREPDTQAAWQRFEATHSSGKTSAHRWLRIAAMFAGVMLMAGIIFAAIRLVSMKRQAPGSTEVQSLTTEPTSPVCFDNVTLDSILTVVAAHYQKTVTFRDEAPRRMTLIMTWQPDAPLADLLDRLNAFDGLSLFLQNDTIFVIQTNEEEDQP
ncbi:MAG: DUF4974 domain-containing protein [Bacteroidaceae bacterium]|nr:DUF4974 domain-containing protein [Bacteroidaceae bacterium]